MRIDNALANTGWAVKEDARHGGQLQVIPRMEAIVDSECNDAWTVITMAALTLNLSNTQRYQRNWTKLLIPTRRRPIAVIEMSGGRLMVDANMGNQIKIGDLLCLRSLKFQLKPNAKAPTTAAT